tara:strand:- start:1358 stop:2050 length:693 start_codon:yes stop_codon:yes gene_type:complete
VRRFLNGRFENSAFCILDPTGQEWLTRSGRGPEQVLGHDVSSVVKQMDSIAAAYRPRGESGDDVVQDFHTFRQALNVASADQRVLLLVAGTEAELAKQRGSLKPVANDDSVIGRFHIDLDSTGKWKEPLGEKSAPDSGFFLIHPGEFGLEGEVIEKLPLGTGSVELLAALDNARKAYASGTEKKTYSTHVAKGRQEGIYFEGAVPYGEDRDGDGVIDHRVGGKDRREPPR